MEVKPFCSANTAPFCLSPDFIVPKENRPTLSDESPKNSVPTIDLKDDNNKQCSSFVPIIDLKDDDNKQCSSLLAQNVSNACEQLVMFHVMINHGIPLDLCHGMLNALLEFFQLPSEERSQFLTTDQFQSQHVKILNYYIRVEDQMNVTMCNETLSHPWHPREDIIHLLSRYPTQYRCCYSLTTHEQLLKAIGCLMNRLLGLMSQVLGLGKDYLVKRIGERPDFYCHANYCPLCPEPELTVGLNEHSNINALAVLQQLGGVTGLHVNPDGNWVPVDPVPGAFVIIVSDQMEVLSNGRYNSPVHRAVTNKWLPRASLAMFCAPNYETAIGPIEDLVDEEHPPFIRATGLRNLCKNFISKRERQEELRKFFSSNNFLSLACMQLK